jgi:hypothetical protein
MLTSAADRAAVDPGPEVAPGVLDALKNFKLPEKPAEVLDQRLPVGLRITLPSFITKSILR